MSAAAFILIIITWLSKRNNYVVFASIGYLIHAISLDLLALGHLDGQLDFGNVTSYSFEYFYSFFVTSCTLITFNFFLESKKETYSLPVYRKKFMRLGLFFLTISFFALALNLSRTGGVALMFIEPRLYEMLFGESVILNYLYFLHLPAAILFAIAYLSSRRTIYLLLTLISITFSIFHGIKYTIIHAFIYPGLIFWIYSGYRINKHVIVGVLAFIAVILIYFNEVRGGQMQGLLGYITSPSVNALYLLAKEDLIINSPLGVIIPDFGFFFQKVADRLLGIPVEISSYDSFVLNEKYNLLPAWYSASLVGLPSHVVVIGLLAILIKFIRRRYEPNVGRSVIEAHIYFTLLLSFTGWALFSLKMIYVIAILLFCFPLKKVNRKTNHHISIQKAYV